MKTKNTSVRDFPVSLSVENNTATLITRLGRAAVCKISFTREEWNHPPGHCWGNPDWDRRQTIRQKMSATQSCSFTEEGAEQAERIADAHLSLLKQAWGSPGPFKNYGEGNFTVINETIA